MFFSAMVQPHDRDYMLGASAEAFLVKPADLDIFIPTVRRLLDESANPQPPSDTDPVTRQSTP